MDIKDSENVKTMRTICLQTDRKQCLGEFSKIFDRKCFTKRHRDCCFRDH